jgi:hypothetical protein
VLVLAKAESAILLLARSHPTNWQALHATLQASWARGDPREPAIEFRPPPDLSSVHAALAQASGVAMREGALGGHLAARAAELDEEASLAEQIGKPGFRSRAARRYAHLGSRADTAADALAAEWSRLDHVPESQSRVASDDFSNPLSLINQMRTEMSRCGISVPMRVDPRLAAIATVDRDCVWVRAGETLHPTHARRVAVHEIQGHAMRRVAARCPENFLSSSGFALSDEDEEGRAIWLERRAGLLDGTRRAELARRHLAADACQRGASFVETVQSLATIGTSLEEALRVALRVWRGGGLAREVIYLRAYLRVLDTLSTSPEVEQWMARGRFSLDVASRIVAGTLSWPAEKLTR